MAADRKDLDVLRTLVAGLKVYDWAKYKQVLILTLDKKAGTGPVCPFQTRACRMWGGDSKLFLFYVHHIRQLHRRLQDWR